MSDSQLLEFLRANPEWSYRWRIKNGKEQWQMVDDGEPSGKWGEFREVIAIAANQAQKVAK